MTGLHDAGDLLARVPRIAELLGDALRWAPATALVLAGAYLLVHAHRERVGAVLSDHVGVEVVAAFAGLLLGAQLLEGALLAPAVHGAWFPTRLVVPAAPFAIAPAAWGLRRFRRSGAVLIAATLVLTAWMLAATLAGDATLAPPSGFGLA